MNRAEEIAVFVQVVETGSLSGAGRRLGLTPSAVSKLLARLEARLGARLLQRTTRRVAPTPEGRAFYERGRELLGEIDALEASVRRSAAEPSGLLTVSLPHGFGMTQIVPLIAGFVARHPKVAIKLGFADHVVDLVAEGIDLGIRLGPVGQDNLIARRLGEHRRITCAAPAYLARHGTPAEPAALAAHECALYDPGERLNEWPYRRPDGSRLTVPVRRGPRSNNGEALLALVRDGLAIGHVADYLVAGDLAAGRVVEILADHAAPEPVPIHAVYPHRRHLATRVRAFVDHLVERFSPLPPWAAPAPGGAIPRPAPTA